MLFHSKDFLVFFAIFFPVYLLLRPTRWVNAWLLAASYFFYAWWNPLYLLLIIATTLVDFYVVRKMEQSPRKKPWLCLSLLSNLSALAYFKYAKFFTVNVNALLSLGHLPELTVADPVLPLGISFFTFQSISYAIDVYRGDFPAERNLLRYATYVSFFPQMISGPICRAGSLIPQLAVAPPVTMAHVTSGASMFLTGVFKKIAVADYLGMYVDKIYADPENFQSPALILATFAFAWQIYFDFSGYIDMARGIARAMGYHLTPNFNAPYVSSDLGEFWTRWNITVSNWFRDYVYIPLGGSREGRAKTVRNVLLTMLTSGIWHGASWTFVLWGAVHGIGRVATKELRFLSVPISRMPIWIQRAGVFLFVTFAWIFFRARSVNEACLIVLRVLTSGFADPRFPVLLALPIALVWTYQLLEARGEAAPRFWDRAPVRVGLAFLMIGYLTLVSQSGAQTFIYFNF